MVAHICANRGIPQVPAVIESIDDNHNVNPFRGPGSQAGPHPKGGGLLLCQPVRKASVCATLIGSADSQETFTTRRQALAGRVDAAVSLFTLKVSLSDVRVL